MPGLKADQVEGGPCAHSHRADWLELLLLTIWDTQSVNIGSEFARWLLSPVFSQEIYGAVTN